MIPPPVMPLCVLEQLTTTGYLSSPCGRHRGGGVGFVVEETLLSAILIEVVAASVVEVLGLVPASRDPGGGGGGRSSASWPPPRPPCSICAERQHTALCGHEVTITGYDTATDLIFQDFATAWRDFGANPLTTWSVLRRTEVDAELTVNCLAPPHWADQGESGGAGPPAWSGEDECGAVELGGWVRSRRV